MEKLFQQHAIKTFTPQKHVNFGANRNPFKPLRMPSLLTEAHPDIKNGISWHFTYSSISQQLTHKAPITQARKPCKRCPFTLQNATFYNAFDRLLHCLQPSFHKKNTKIRP